MIERHSYEHVKSSIEKTGFTLLSSNYKNNSSELIVADKEGYKYTTSYQKILQKNINTNKGRFYKNNPFTIDNISLYLKLNNIPLEIISDVYVGSKEKLTYTDNFGYFYEIALNELFHNKSFSKFHQSNSYTMQNIRLWCSHNNKNFEILDNEYNSSIAVIKVKCLEENCNEIFESTWQKINRNIGCPFCAGIQIGVSNCLATVNPELAKEWHPTKNGALTPHELASKSGKKVWWKCERGHEWETSPNVRSKGIGCPYCSGRCATEEYNLLQLHPDICLEWDYDKNTKPPSEYTPVSGQHTWWICKECKKSWETMISCRTANNTGCPYCKFSKGEKEINKILDANNIHFLTQYSFNDLLGIGGNLLKFDVAIFDDKEKIKLKMLIEYDGIFHYEKQYDDDGYETIQIHDKRKNDYCNLNNIKLLRIPYWDFDNIEEILIKELSVPS